MVSTVQQYQFNNKLVDIDLSQVPEMSVSLKNIFENLGVQLPPSFQSASPLADRIHSMEETSTLLKEAKENSTKNKVIAFLKTALLVALVGGIICACVFGGEVAIPLAIILGTFSYLFLCVGLYCQAGQKIENIEQRLPGYHKPWYFPRLYTYDFRAFFPLLGAAFVLPLFEAFTRETRLERVLQEQKKSIESDLSNTNQKNHQLLPIAYQFYKDQSPVLLDRLNQKIEQSEKSLADMERLPERSLAGEKELKERIAALMKARETWNATAQFYHQFD